MLSEVDGGTRINAGGGNTLTINGVTPGVLAGSVLIEGELISGNDDFNLQSALQNVANSSAMAEALSRALNKAMAQGSAEDTSNANRIEVAADETVLINPDQPQDISTDNVG